MAYSLKQPMSSLLVNGTHRFASCWVIERRDGVVLRFTDHDRQLVIDGHTFVPIKGTSSARQRSEGTSPQNAELSGQISSDMLTHADLLAGRYRSAKITEFTVDWQYPFAGKFRSNVYYVEDTTFDGEVWMATVAGVKTRLGTSFGDLLERGCRFDLGDINCGVNLPALAMVGEVQTISVDRLKFTTDLTNPNDWFADGHVVWITGDNFTTKQDIKAYAAASGEVELFIRTPFPIQVGDQGSFYPGCNKLIGVNPDGSDDPTGHCLHKFNNLLNHGGWFTIPGNDDVLKTPDAKA